jgi:hypothetical protein
LEEASSKCLTQSETSQQPFSHEQIQLENRMRQVESERESYKMSWEAAEKLIDDLSEQWDGLSLRAKIVNKEAFYLIYFNQFL